MRGNNLPLLLPCRTFAYCSTATTPSNARITSPPRVHVCSTSSASPWRRRKCTSPSHASLRPSNWAAKNSSLIENDAFSIQFGEFNKPNFFVTYRSIALWHQGAHGLHQRFLAWLGYLPKIVSKTVKGMLQKRALSSVTLGEGG